MAVTKKLTECVPSSKVVKPVTARIQTESVQDARSTGGGSGRVVLDRDLATAQLPLDSIGQDALRVALPTLSSGKRV